MLLIAINFLNFALKLNRIMRIKHFILASVIMLASCASQQKAAIPTADADQAFANKDYVTALAGYNKVIDQYKQKNRKAPADVMASAGKCLYMTGNKEKAMEYLISAETQGFSDSQSVLLMAKYYAEIDNMSKELDCLEKFVAMDSLADGSDYVCQRLVDRLVEMSEYDRAFAAYGKMSDADRGSVANLEKYHQICKKLGKDDEADKTAQQLYKMDPNNLIGLSAAAYNAYITTENEYVAAIKAYEAKKTNEAYARLQKTTAPLTARFKKARDLYVKLYGITKKPHDAAILSRIYTRLNDKKNADYYAKLSKQ